MSMILITHDLGVVKGRTDEIMVMYGGRTMEEAPTSTLFESDGLHPYTEALNATIPRIDTPSHTRLVPIPGKPPEVIGKIIGCPFVQRCRYSTSECLTEMPPLIEREEGHLCACHNPVGSPEGIKAREANQNAGYTPSGLDMKEFETSAVKRDAGES